MDISELIKKCQLEDIESFNELYRIYNVKAFKTAFFIAGNRQLAEDILQEAFIKCYFEIKKLKNPEQFNSWFYSLLVRTGWRISSKNKKILSKELNSDEIDLFHSFDNTEELAEKLETGMKVNDALKKLSIPLKTTVILHYFNDLSINEISKIMDCFQGTVKSRLHTARKLIIKELEKESGKDISFIKPFERECLNNE